MPPAGAGWNRPMRSISTLWPSSRQRRTRRAISLVLGLTAGTAAAFQDGRLLEAERGRWAGLELAEAGEGDGFAFAELLEDVDDGSVEMIGGLRFGFAFAGQELNELLFCHGCNSGHTTASEKDPADSLAGRGPGLLRFRGDG